MHEQSLGEPVTQNTNSPLFRLQDFEGPLDVLLYLIRKNEVNIYDIPVARITEQYLEFLTNTKEHDLENLTDFYTMAVSLVYLKSRMLLPLEITYDDEIEDPRKDLVERLIEYQKFKKITQLMQSKEAESDWYLERRKIINSLPVQSSEEQLWEELEIWDLVKTFSKIMQGLSTDRLLSLYEEVSVNEKIALIYEFIETKIEFAFEDLLTRPGSMVDAVCAFLAVLECCKMRLIIVVQQKFFGAIRLQARPNEVSFNV